MQDKWYGDNRDVVKWGALVSLALEAEVPTILQLTFRPPQLDEEDWPSLVRNKTKISPFPPSVWTHFRRLGDISRLSGEAGLRIRVVDQAFEHAGWQTYFQALRELPEWQGRKIIFMDPDTGMEPTRLKPEHVALGEVDALWAAIAPGDWLVLYQHGWRDKKWLQKIKKRFAQRTRSEITDFTSSKVKDVALLAALKARV